jgi:glutamine amidotransferase
MNIALIKYNAGNIQSVVFALERIGIEPIVTSDEKQIQSADKIIFPGVGEAGSAMNFLKERNLDVTIKNLKQPVLGICLGMQLLCKHSEEGDMECLGIFDGNVKKFAQGLKVPQVGWNLLENVSDPLLSELETDSYFYFVHSYYAEICTNTSAITEYGIKFSSALQKNNFYGVQFHPEKSARTGEKVLKNFLNL